MPLESPYHLFLGMLATFNTLRKSICNLVFEQTNYTFDAPRKVHTLPLEVCCFAQE